MNIIISFIKSFFIKKQPVIYSDQPTKDDRVIIEDKIYNISKSDRVFTFREWEGLLNRKYLVANYIYRTQTGLWFSIKDRDVREVKTETEEHVKRILKKHHKIELYEKYFGKLEEV